MMPSPLLRLARPARGFTLVEVLVALVIMAVLAGLAWRGLDGIVRSRDIGSDVLDRSLRINAVVTQWEQDLMAVQETGAVPPISFDGQSLRLTRRVEGGVALVVWSVRGGTWQRWVAPVSTRALELGEYWLRSQQLLGNEPGQQNLAEASDWQVYFFRGNAWTNAQSTGDFQQVDMNRFLPPPSAAPPASPPPAPAPDADSDQAAQQGEADPNAPAPDPQQPSTGNNAEAEAAARAAREAQRELLPEAVRLVITLRQGALTRDIALGPGG